MDKPSFVEGGQAQLRLLAACFEHAETHGYYVIVQNQNNDARSDRHLYNYLAGGLNQFVRDWGLAHGRRCLIINVWPGSNPDRSDLRIQMRVPRRHIFRPIIASLAVVSAKQESRYEARRSNKGLRYSSGTDYVEYHGLGRDALAVILRILDMPQHREILTGPFRVGK